MDKPAISQAQIDAIACSLKGLPPEMDKAALLAWLETTWAEGNPGKLRPKHIETAHRAAVDALFAVRGNPKRILTMVAVTLVNDHLRAHLQAYLENKT